MKKVLVITYYWPPSGGSGVQRWVKMCKYLPQWGWQPVVYTPANPAVTSIDESLLADIDPSLEVITRRILEPGQFARKSTSSQVTPINAQKKTFKQRVAMWIRANVFIPDPRVLWVRPSIRTLEKYLKDHPVDAIVSTGPPHSVHLIARGVAAATGIPWVADFRDPWTRMFYFKHLPLSGFALRRHTALEKSVLDDCTRVVAVTPFVQREFRQMTSTPVECVTNGFDEGDFPAMESERMSSDSPFVIAHTGLFAADGNPENLWEALSALARESSEFSSRLRIVLCGKTDRAVKDSIVSAGLGKHLEDRGYLPHAEAAEVMRRACVLILPLRREPEYRSCIPGKTFEYLASRRPVIGIGQKDGIMAEIISGAGAGTTFDWDETEQLRSYIGALFDRFAGGEGLPDNPRDISKYSRRSLAKAYAQILDSLQ